MELLAEIPTNTDAFLPVDCVIIAQPTPPPGAVVSSG